MMMFDKLVVDASDVRKTADGYLTAFPRVARTGIQIYAGREVGRADLETVRVFRSEAEVFSKDTMHSFAHRPVTVDHPPVLVTADNWRKYSRGQTGEEVARDGETIRVPMVMMDREAIKAFEDGKRELSMGYTCDVKWEAGVTDGGEKYDAVQYNIRANHLAVVAAARGGPTLRIGDDNNGVEVMDKQIMVDGVSVTMSDIAASVVARALGGYESQIKAINDAFEKYKGETAAEKKKREEEEASAKKDSVALQTQIANKDTEIETLKKQLDAQKSKTSGTNLDAMVRDREGIKAKAKAILGDAATALNDKNNEEIRRAVVLAVMKDKAKDWNDEHIAISFDSIQAPTVDIHVHSDGINALAANLSLDATVVDDREKAYGEYLKDLANGWKRPAA